MRRRERKPAKRGFDSEHAAAHGYIRADRDAVDSPELTDAEQARAKPLRDALPAAAALHEDYAAPGQRSTKGVKIGRR